MTFERNKLIGILLAPKDEWTLYVPKNPVPEFPTFIVLPFLAIIVVTAVLVLRKLITKRTSTFRSNTNLKM